MFLAIPRCSVAGYVELCDGLVVLQGCSNDLGSSSIEAVVADVELHQCPDGETYISKGGTGDILGVLALTCTREWQPREL